MSTRDPENPGGRDALRSELDAEPETLESLRERGAQDPFRDLVTLRDQMNELFETSVVGQRRGGATTPAWEPPLDLFETQDELVLTAELPGLEAEEVELCLDNESSEVVLSGVRRRRNTASGDAQFIRVERNHGQFLRRIQLPSAVDPAGCKARYTDGVLRLVMRKTDGLAGSEPIRLDIEA